MRRPGVFLRLSLAEVACARKVKKTMSNSTMEERLARLEGRLARSQRRSRMMIAVSLAAVVGVVALLAPQPARTQGQPGLPALEARVATLETTLAVQCQEIADLQTALAVEAAAQAAADSALVGDVSDLQGKLVFVDVDGTDMFITGANLHIRNGTTHTFIANGVGNLIVGYNEDRPFGPNVRTGSHNVVVGAWNNFSSYGGLVVGSFNTISGSFASVSGGHNNVASGVSASVSGGRVNHASALMPA